MFVKRLDANKMSNNRWPKQLELATAILGLCLVAFVIFDDKSYTDRYHGLDGRRSLRDIDSISPQQTLRRLETTRNTIEIEQVQNDIIN